MIKKLFIIILIINSINIANAINIVDTNKYQDYACNYHELNNFNIIIYPMYIYTDEVTEYNLTACNINNQISDNISIPKRYWLNYNFMDNEISRYAKIDNFSQINNLVTKINSTTWYLKLPFTSKQYKKITNNLIDLGIFKESLNFNVIDNNSVSYPFQIVTDNKQIDIYFNPQNYQNITYPLYIYENTLIVNSNTIQYSSDSEIALSSPPIVKVKSLTMTDSYTGSWNISFRLRGDFCPSSSCNDGNGDITSTGHAQIYKNGIPYGIIHAVSGANWQTFTDTFTSININNGDTIELWGYADSGGQGFDIGAVDNFRVLFNISTPTITKYNQVIWIE